MTLQICCRLRPSFAGQDGEQGAGGPYRACGGVGAAGHGHLAVPLELAHDHASAGLTSTKKNLAEEIDQVVTRTLAGSWDNTDARNRGVRRATAAVFRRYTLKPVGEPYDSTVAYIEAHYLVD
ncbi:hypothetical protein ACFQ9Z_36210 [Streptomyces sp. NPDC056580]|uniref:hypothetical protein n=1 Tax=Streptomyces sp. NPDC056580 TaxID=3345872 RepID=UPI00368A4A61